MSRNVTIRERAAICVDLFSQAILLLAQTESSEDQNGLLDEFGRFKLWTSNIGVFADLHSSLDYRLRDSNDIKDSFTRQLTTTESRLQQLLDAAQQDLSKTSIKEDEDEGPGISTSTKSTTAATFHDWNNTQILQSIHQSIDWLHRLSNLVRKASFANQHKRADKFILKDDDDNDMSDTLTDYYTKLIKREFNGMQDTLVQRLAASMLVRRRRIMYRRYQQQRWKIPQVEPKAKNLQLVTPSTKLMPNPLEPSVPFQNEKLAISKPEAMTTAQSRLTATTIDKNIRQRVSAPSGISKGSTAPLNEQSMLLVPPPPKGVNLGEDFVCDYCCLILPSKIALNRNAWADHVHKDLYPYVCVVDKCDDPIEIYSSRKEWLAHMRTRHLMRWYCMAKLHAQPLEFDSEAGFIEHMEIRHPGKFRNDQLSLVADNSSRPKEAVFDDCPFCIGTSDNLEEHVGLHLRDLALRSLPWPDDDERYSQRGEYLHSDDSLSNENIRGTIMDFRLEPRSDFTWGLNDISDSENSSDSEHSTDSQHYIGERLDLYGHFKEIANQHKPMDLRDQLSDKALIRLALEQYQGFPQLSNQVNRLQALLDDEFWQPEDTTAIEKYFFTMQQLKNAYSLDHKGLQELASRATGDHDETVPSIHTQPPRRFFEIAIICTLLSEYDAVCLIFDELWDKDYKQNEQDEIIYTTGRVGMHNVVLALLPHTGEITAAASVAHVRMMYSQLKLFLLVGICRGVPTSKSNYGEEEIVLLGDVVISQTVVEYDLNTNNYIRSSTLRFRYRDKRDIAGEATLALNKLYESKSSRTILQSETLHFLWLLQNKEIAGGKLLDEAKAKYNYPGALKDCLFEADYIHKHRITADDCSVCGGHPDAVCDGAREAYCHEIGCDEGYVIIRRKAQEAERDQRFNFSLFQKAERDQRFNFSLPQKAEAPVIHLGMIASGDVVVTNGLERDKISKRARIIAFDMNIFDGWKEIPCIFIKGVCNYADGHKDESWQNFAAATAAAAAKALLTQMRHHDDDHMDNR